MATLLRDTQILNAKPKKKVWYLSDGDNLRIQIHPNGGKYWQVRYRLGRGENSVDKTLRLGTYPGRTIRDARAERDRIRDLVSEDIDPAITRKTPVRSPVLTPEPGSKTFREVVKEWTKVLPGKNGASEPSRNTRVSREGRFNKHVYPYIGGLPIGDVTVHHVLDILKRIEHKGDTRNRIKGDIESILFYAMAHKYIDEIPAKIPTNVLKAKPKVQHRKALPWEDLPKFLDDLDARTPSASNGGKARLGLHPTIKIAIKLMILTLARPGEVRFAVWSEFDFRKRIWAIPAGRMKEDRPHVVHLSDQTMELLKELKKMTGKGERLFPKITDRYTKEWFDDSSSISENTMLEAIRNLGYDCDPHGFRGMASTYLNSIEDEDERQMWDFKWIEFALSHKDRDQVAEAYNAYRYEKPRARMLQYYADQVMPR
jgi:integrase